jgi:putative ABC transport system permease protein
MLRSSRSSICVLAVNNVMCRPARAILALTGLSVPVLGILGLFGLSAGIRRLLDETLAQVQGILVIRSGAPLDLVSELPASLAASIRSVPGVRTVVPQLCKLAPPIEGRRTFLRRRPGRLEGRGSSLLDSYLNMVQIEGHDLQASARLRFDVYRDRLLPSESGGGRFLRISDRGQPRVVISRRLARDYPRNDGKPRVAGDVLRIGGRPFTIVGIYDTGSMLLDGSVFMEIGTARDLLKVAESTVSCYLVEPEDPNQAEWVAKAIEREVPGIDARTMDQYRLGAGRMLSRANILLSMLIGLAFVAGAVGILNTMLMSTSERIAEFGTLRANGWTRGDVLRLVLTESVCLGLLAGLIGCSLAVLGTVLVNAFLKGGIQLQMSPWLTLLGLGLAAVLSTLGGLYPAWHASRLAPMEAIRTGSR